MNRQTRLILVFILATMIASIISFFFWDFVRDAIVIPIYFLLWVSDLLIKSVPQQAYLAVLVLLCAGISLNTLARSKPPAPVRQQRRRPITESTRYRHWRRVYRNLYGSLIFRSKLATESRDFLLSLLAYQEGLDPARVEAMILDGSLEVPAAVKTFIERREFEVPLQESSVLRKLGLRLRRLIIDNEPELPQQDNAHVVEVITFIEHRLEINHAGNQRG